MEGGVRKRKACDQDWQENVVTIVTRSKDKGLVMGRVAEVTEGEESGHHEEVVEDPLK